MKSAIISLETCFQREHVHNFSIIDQQQLSEYWYRVISNSILLIIASSVRFSLIQETFTNPFKREIISSEYLMKLVS